MSQRVLLWGDCDSLSDCLVLVCRSGEADGLMSQRVLLWGDCDSDCLVSVCVQVGRGGWPHVPAGVVVGGL